LTFKKGGLRFWVTFTEKYGMPWLIGKHQPGSSTTEKEAILDMLEKMVQDGIAVIPNNAEIEFKESANRGASVAIYSAMLSFCNEEISKALLGQTLTTQVGETGGAYAASKTHGDVRQEIVDADRRMVEAALNELIDWICWLNFGQAERPRFSMYAEEDVDKAQAERDEMVTRSGRVKLTKAYYQRAYGSADDELEVSEPPKSPSLPGQGPAFAEGQPPVNAVDQVVDRLEQEAPADDLLEPIRKLVMASTSFDELRDKLLDAYKDMDASGIAELMALAMSEASLLGRDQVIDQTGLAA
jgi:phage gp29-like protein